MKAGLVALLGIGSAVAGTDIQVTDAPAGSAREWWRDLPSVYEGSVGSAVQSLDFTGIMQWQYAHVDASQGEADENEFRRFRFGLDSRFLNHFAFRGKVNFDPKANRFYKSLSQNYVSFSPYGNEKSDFERFRISAGKMKGSFSAEQAISPKRLKTFERSLLSNQLAPAKSTSILLGGSNGCWDYSLSGMAGELSAEFSNFDDGTLLLARAGYSPKPSLRIGLDYLTVFGDQQITSNIRHAVSLSATHNSGYDDGNLATMVDLLYGVGEDRQPDVFGVVLLSCLQLGPRWELVARYQYASSDGPDGLRLRRRYELAAIGLSDGRRGDRYHAGYLGANYRIFGDKLKLMGGVEYSHMDGGSNGGTFNGWTWLAGVRSYF